jgi:hypothetical protein
MHHKGKIKVNLMAISSHKPGEMLLTNRRDVPLQFEEY